MTPIQSLAAYTASILAGVLLMLAAEDPKTHRCKPWWYWVVAILVALNIVALAVGR